MKVHLFNDKQVITVFKSVQRHFQESFNKAQEELKALLDDEVKRQLESNSEVEELKIKRQAKLDVIYKLVELNKQVISIDSNYKVSSNGYRNFISPFAENSEKATFDFNEDTKEQCNEAAMSAAKNVLGIDNIGYREDCLFNDIKARIATMQVSDYDSVVSQLEAQIKINDYFVTL